MDSSLLHKQMLTTYTLAHQFCKAAKVADKFGIYEHCHSEQILSGDDICFDIKLSKLDQNVAFTTVLHHVYHLCKSIFSSTVTKESNKMFPLYFYYNPSLPNIGNILHSDKHHIYDSPSLGSIIPSYRRPKNIPDILSRLL